MALYEIVIEGDPVLRQKATRIRQVDTSIREIADDMFETMLYADGVGLAAPQIGLSRRLIVVHVPENYQDEGNPEYSFKLVNPEIVRGHGSRVGAEGCLSIPGWAGEVERQASVTVKAIDMDNKPVRIKATGHLAVVLQHEIDHLDGILYTDRIEDKSKLWRVETEAEEAEVVEA